MNSTRFDRISKLFARRRGSRHALAQEATPTGAADAEHGPTMLFVQTFRAGAITAKEGAEGRYTLALEGGQGQTVYFSDRPARLAGATSTGEFLDRLGFPDDNPPNAALVVETAPGETDVAVVELFSPVYDTATGGVTYEVEVLANWQDELGVGLHEAPTDLAALAPNFGAAHLFIDSLDGALDCPSKDIVCYPVGSGHPERDGNAVGVIRNAEFGGWCLRLGTFDCYPCRRPAGGGSWWDECDRRFLEACRAHTSGYDRRRSESCAAYPVCTTGNPYNSSCYPNY